MKKKFVYFSIMFCVFAFTLFFFSVTSYAGTQKMNNLSYEVNLKEDGSAEITEIWDITVSDTNTLFKNFDINGRFGEIKDVKVAEYYGVGEENQFINSNKYAYHVQKGYFYALEVENNKYEIAWGVSIDTRTNKTYKITYTVTNAVTNYADCSEFYWQFLGTTNGIPVDNITGTIKLPETHLSKENIKVWAHGPLNGEIYAVDNRTVTFNVKYLEAQTMLEIRVASLEKVFAENTKIINTAMLQNIIAEETNWADAANKERDRIKSELMIEKAIITVIVILAIGLYIGGIVFCIKKYIKYKEELKKLNENKKEEAEKIQYYREIPDENATPSEAAFLYYFSAKGTFEKNISKIVSAIIMNLALKKAIRIENDKNGNIDIVIIENYEEEKKKLKADEIAIYDMLLEALAYKAKKNKKEEISNKISMKDIEKYAKNNDRRFLGKINRIESNAGMLQEMKQNYSKKMIKKSDEWIGRSQGYFIVGFLLGICVIPILIAILCFIDGLICKKISKRTREFALTEKGKQEQELWLGLKRYMEDFSLLSEREVPELVLWEKYLVYATAFGIADKVIKQLKVKYPELNDENYMISHGYMYLYMANRYDFDRTLNNSIQRAYDAGVRARQAREAAASSSYSSGSGRRRRLLRRRRPEEEAEAGMGGR